MRKVRKRGNKVMKTFICVKRAAILLDAIIGISADNEGNVYIARDTTAPQLVEPYDEDELRQYIRNGELDACNIGCGDAAFELPADAETCEQNSNLPALLFVVRDRKGDVKFCDAQFALAGCTADIGKNFAARVGVRGRINYSTFLFNFDLGVGNALENSN